MKRRFRSTSIGLGVALWALTLVSPPAALAAADCVLAPNAVELTVNLAAGDSASVAVVPVDLGNPDPSDPSVNKLVLTSTPATSDPDCEQLMDGVEQVNINGSTGDESVTFDLSGGPFLNGIHNQSLGGTDPGADEVEFIVDLGAGNDSIFVQGTDGNDGIAFGSDTSSANSRGFGDYGINMNVAFSGITVGTTYDADIDVFLGEAVDPLPSNPTNKATSADWVSSIENFTAYGGGGRDRLSGLPTHDFLTDLTFDGGSGNDDLWSSHGDDTLIGGDGADDLRGGGGVDTVSYASAPSPIGIKLDGFRDEDTEKGNDGVGCTAPFDLASCEGDNIHTKSSGRWILIGSDFDDEMTGDSSQNTLRGGDGNDLLVGGGGNDLLVGEGGNDTEKGGSGHDTFDQGSSDDGADHLMGGYGSDTVDYSGRSAPVTVRINKTADDGESGEGDFVGELLPGASEKALPDVENARGGSGSDTLVGSDNNNRLEGGPGNAADTLFGGSGNDTLDGGGGDDQEFGQKGSDIFLQGSSSNGGDRLSGSSGNDTVNYAGRDIRVVVRLDSNANDGQSGENDLALSVEKVKGGSGNDEIWGGASANWLWGNDGNDEIRGEAGSDSLWGGSGSDDLFGGTGADTLRGGEGPDSCAGGGQRGDRFDSC